jgi:ribosomal protein S18 acetylase RimI-like enzyme
MAVECLHDRREIEKCLRTEALLHLYELGDLDDDAWPFTSWYGLRNGAALTAVTLLYTRPSLPVVLALGEANREQVRALVRAAMELLPARFYAHLSPRLEMVLAERYRLESRGQHLKMALMRLDSMRDADTGRAEPMSPADAADAQHLYEDSYPGHWFEADELESKPYFGVRSNGRLVSIAGVHAYSERYGVAALGNVATHPAYRRQGLGRAATAALCQFLSERVEHIGLNVKSTNEAAMRCYESLGFERVASYGEYVAQVNLGRS